jgi:putative nucleotidyltransferase with HDIG domain
MIILPYSYNSVNASDTRIINTVFSLLTIVIIKLMNIRQIYAQYFTPRNLQDHMMRVAGTAHILLDKWHGADIDHRSIIIACLLHDIAKPITFDLTRQSEFGMTRKEIERLAELQEKLVAQYGTEEHLVAVAICKELRCETEVVRIVENFEWRYLSQLLAEEDLSSLVAIYCDMRIGPKGILLMHDRLRELEQRTRRGELSKYSRLGEVLEGKIAQNTRAQLLSIEDSDLEKLCTSLMAIRV